MSEAYDLFIKEFNSTAREKLDGYSLENLNHLSSTERREVLTKLTSELPLHSEAIKPLAYLDPDLTVELLKQLLTNLPQEKLRRSYDVYFWLWSLTKEDGYLTSLVECRRHISDYDIIAFFSIIKIAVNSSIIYNFFKNSITSETNTTAISVVAEALLEENGIPYSGETKEQHKKIWKVLKDGNKEEKVKILANFK